MQTISRNTNAHKAAISAAQAITCYDLGSCFSGYKTTAERLQAAAAKGKLTKRDNGTSAMTLCAPPPC